MNIKSSLILGISIIIGFLLLGFIQGSFQGKETITNEKGNEPKDRYEFVRANDNNVIIFDKQTGQYWRKFIPNSEGPTEWTQENSPIK
ncbi:hypothetical protein [Paenibacillus sp. Marseille-Q4541]|uniref:hypothetical protein n=1 Tax=Paenibacillus sp. Marseille-Q4541 TaxID=2831522 RepID=UPI001BA72BD6|nr:hypothetical protein [Paenibacillus sp. Marseille-Q4541]